MNARVGVTESDYGGKTVAGVITDVAIPNMKLIFNYQSIIVAIQMACQRYSVSPIGTEAPEERASLK